MMVAGDHSVRGILEGKNYVIFDWHKGWKEVLKKLKDYHAVVVDSYMAREEIYEDISQVVSSKLYIDDYKRIDYPSGVVLNGSIYAYELDYPKKEGVRYFLGPKYVPLRSAFWKVGRKRIRKRPKRILITFGGDDLRNMTPKVLSLLKENFIGLEFLVVVGKGFNNRELILSMADARTKIFEGLTAEGMRDLMLYADMAISAGGQTTYELARVGTPAVLVAVAENQLLNCKGWEKAGFAIYAGWWEEGKLFEKILTYTERLVDFELRNAMSKKGKKLVDGQGAKRVVKELTLSKKPLPLSYPLQ